MHLELSELGCFVRGQQIDLTDEEWKLLTRVASCSRQMLVVSPAEKEILDPLAESIRSKIEADADDPEFLVDIWGAVCGFQIMNPETSDPGTVYFISGAGLVKIGFSKGDVGKRLSLMQSNSPVALTVERTLWCRHVQHTETRLQRWFSRHRANGEWFDDSILEALAKMTDAELKRIR